MNVKVQKDDSRIIEYWNDGMMINEKAKYLVNPVFLFPFFLVFPLKFKIGLAFACLRLPVGRQGRQEL